MSRPTPLEIQDALFAQPLRLALYATATLAALAFFAPWEAGPDGITWTWDLWSGREAFLLVPLVGGTLLAGAAAFEAVPGLALGAGALLGGAVWVLAAADGFHEPWLLLAGGDADRATLAAVVVPVMLAGLAWRRALHRTLVGRIFLGLGVAAVAALFFVPLGQDGSSLFQTAVLDRFAAGDPAAIAAAVPPLLVLLATLAGAVTVLPSTRGTGGLSTVARAAFHLAAAAAAAALLLPFVVLVPDQPSVTYGLFAAPLKLAALWWCALVWLGLGAGTLAAALEAHLRRAPLTTRRQPEAAPAAPAASPLARPIAQGAPVVLEPAAAAAPLPAQRPLDLSPLPPPPGFGGPTDGVPPELLSREPSEVVELKAQHALPILDTSPAPRGAAPLPPPPPAPPPAAPAPVTAAVAPRPGLRGVRTVLGMPGAPPAVRPAAGGADVPRPDQSGRTGDTSLGLPVTRPRPPAAKAPATKPPEDAGLRFWPPQIEDQAVRHDAATPAFGVHIIRELAMQDADATRPTPVSTAAAALADSPAPTPAMGTPAAAAAALGRAVPAEDEPSGAAADAVRFRVSALQRQLARGELTAEEYQRRLDELRKPPR